MSEHKPSFEIKIKTNAFLEQLHHEVIHNRIGDGILEEKWGLLLHSNQIRSVDQAAFLVYNH